MPTTQRLPCHAAHPQQPPRPHPAADPRCTRQGAERGLRAPRAADALPLSALLWTAPYPSGCSSAQSPPNRRSCNCTHRHRDYFRARPNDFSHARLTAAPRLAELLRGMQPGGPQHSAGRQGRALPHVPPREAAARAPTRRTHVKPNPTLQRAPSWLEPQLLGLQEDLIKSLRSSPIFLLGYERQSAWPRLTPRARREETKGETQRSFLRTGADLAQALLEAAVPLLGRAGTALRLPVNKRTLPPFKGTSGHSFRQGYSQPLLSLLRHRGVRGAPLPALLSTPGRHSRTADLPGRRANAAASSGLRETNGPERAPRGRAGAGRQAAAPGERGAARRGAARSSSGARAGRARGGRLTYHGAAAAGWSRPGPAGCRLPPVLPARGAPGEAPTASRLPTMPRKETPRRLLPHLPPPRGAEPGGEPREGTVPSGRAGVRVLRWDTGTGAFLAPV